MSGASSQDFDERLRAALERHGPLEHGRFAVAFSGGLDSTVLLAAMARLTDGHALRALHVDHALHPDSADWERHCRAVAAGLGVPLDSTRVSVDRDAPEGLEAAAREARYAAFAERLEQGETLLTAHHADDQLETLLLRLMRGTGVRGLRGILPFAPLGRGAVARPLLDFERREIRARAETLGLAWLEDPSNRDVDLDRNYMRARVVPLLRERWSAAARCAGRVAAAMTDAEGILGTVAEADLAELTAPDRIPLATLQRLGPPRRRNALRRALRATGLPMPTARQLEQLCAAADVVRPDAETRVAWPGAEARVWRETLYLLDPNAFGHDDFAAETAAAAGRPARISAAEAWSGAQGRLSLAPVEEGAMLDGPIVPETWARDGFDIRFRTGGERFKPAGDRHTRTLKHWLQQQGIVPWMRERIPLLYRGDSLVAVADLAVDESARLAAADAPGNAPGRRIEWSNHACLR